MITEKDYCDLDTCHELWVMGLEPEAYYDGPHIFLYEAQKWLREEKNIHIEIYACAGGYVYELCKAYKANSFSGGTTIYEANDVGNLKLNDVGKYETYEESLAEGIKAAVKILKKEVI